MGTHPNVHANYFLVYTGPYLSQIGSDQKDEGIYGTQPDDHLLGPYQVNVWTIFYIVSLTRGPQIRKFQNLVNPI